MARKRSSNPISKRTKLDTNVLKYQQHILNGKMLVIDPSSGSSGSMPGYALFDEGIMVEYGNIEITLPNPIHVRLQELNKIILEEFSAPDVFVIENIPPSMGFSTSGLAVRNLHRSVGTIMGAVKCEPIIEITPMSWRRYIDGYDYKKSDWNDAIVMGFAVIDRACILVPGPDGERIPHPCGKLSSMLSDEEL